LISVAPTVPVPVTADATTPEEAQPEQVHTFGLGLAKGRALSVTTAVPAMVLRRLIRTVEGA
jgi:hypothetical protein